MRSSDDGQAHWDDTALNATLQYAFREMLARCTQMPF